MQTHIVWNKKMGVQTLQINLGSKNYPKYFISIFDRSWAKSFLENKTISNMESYIN